MVTYHLKEKKNSFFHFFPTKVKKLFSFVNFIILFFIFFYRPLLQPSFFFFFSSGEKQLICLSMYGLLFPYVIFSSKLFKPEE